MIVEFIIASVIAIVWLTPLFIMSNKIQYYKKLYQNEKKVHMQTKAYANSVFERKDGWNTSNDLPLSIKIHKIPYDGELN